MPVLDKVFHWNGEQVKKEEAIRPKKQEMDTGEKGWRRKGEPGWEPGAGLEGNAPRFAPEHRALPEESAKKKTEVVD